MLGNTFAAKQNSKPPNKEVPPKVGLYIQSFNLIVYDSMLLISKLTANICYPTVMHILYFENSSITLTTN